MKQHTGRPRQPGARYDTYKLTKAEKDSAMAIFNEDEPNAIVNFLPECILEALKEIPEIYFTWSERALEKNADLDERDYRLRIAFWDEYNYALDNRVQTLSIAKIIRGVCARNYFDTQVLTSPKKLAWIFFPPADYTKFMSECLHLSMRRMREVLALEIKDSKGKINHKLIEQQMKIWERVEARVRGAIPQALNINQKSVNLNMNQNSNSPTRISNSSDLAAIEAEIAMLEGKEPPLQIEEEKSEDLQSTEGVIPMEASPQKSEE